MTRKNTVSTNLLFIAAVFLCFQVHAAAFLSQETSTGIVDIQKDSQGFFVDVELRYFSMGPRPKRDPPIPYTVKMMVSLSNSETLAASHCLNFRDYDYLSFNWGSYNNWETTISYPNFNASVLAGYTDLVLDRKYWGIPDTKVFLTRDFRCQTGAYGLTIGFDRIGVLGLGYDMPRGNPWLWNNFSVFIKPDLSAGKLTFGGNYPKSSGPAYKLSADSDWRVSSARGSIGVKSFSAAFENRNVIFDINSEAIGLPYDLFTSFTSYFARLPGISCSSDFYRPSCKTTGSIQDLPDITLSLNNINIRIPSKIYASPDNSSSSFKLNLKATSPSFASLSYVTPAFKDSIILDAHFMSYYFTMFDATSGSGVISLYPTVVEKDPESPNWFQRLVNWAI